MSRTSLTRRSFIGAAAATAFVPYVKRANAAGPKPTRSRGAQFSL
jgi:hypothetical protein